MDCGLPGHTGIMVKGQVFGGIPKGAAGLRSLAKRLKADSTAKEIVEKGVLRHRARTQRKGDTDNGQFHQNGGLQRRL